MNSGVGRIEGVNFDDSINWFINRPSIKIEEQSEFVSEVIDSVYEYFATHNITQITLKDFVKVFLSKWYENESEAKLYIRERDYVLKELVFAALPELEPKVGKEEVVRLMEEYVQELRVYLPF